MAHRALQSGYMAQSRRGSHISTCQPISFVWTELQWQMAASVRCGGGAGKEGIACLSEGGSDRMEQTKTECSSRLRQDKHIIAAELGRLAEYK